VQAEDPDAFNMYDPGNVAPIVVWLASDAARGVTGRVIESRGSIVRVLEGWTRGPEADKGARWDLAELDTVLSDLIDRSAPPFTLRTQRASQQ
jgi:hypothetical protein